MNKKWKILAISLLTIGIIGIAVSPTDEEKIETKLEQNDEMTYKERIRTRIGTGVDIQVQDDITSNGKLLQLTTHNPAHGLYNLRWSASDLMELAFKEDQTKTVRVIFTSEVVDMYGEEKEVEVYSVEVSRLDAEKINWEQFDYDNLSKIGNEWVHQAWR